MLRAVCNLPVLPGKDGDYNNIQWISCAMHDMPDCLHVSYGGLVLGH